MLNDITLNWLAVLLATLAYYLLGALWFTPLFGKAWDTAVGVPRARGDRFPPLYYIAPLIGSLVVSLATAVLVSALDLRRLSDALVLGLVLGLGHAAVSLTNAVTPNTPRPLLFAAVTGGYHVAATIAAAAVIVALR